MAWLLEEIVVILYNNRTILAAIVLMKGRKYQGLLSQAS
jgi:hypothetical protein